MKRKRKNIVKKIYKGIINFFTEEDNEGDKVEGEADINLKTLFLIFIIGAVIIVSFYLFFGSSRVNNDETSKELNDTTIPESEALEFLRNQYDICKTDVEFLKSQYDSCEQEIKSLKQDYRGLEDLYIELQQNYYDILENYSMLEELNLYLEQENKRCSNTLLELTDKLYPLDYITNYCEDCFIHLSLDDIQNNRIMKIKYVIPHNKKDWQIFLHKIKERLFNINVDYGWVYMYKYLPNMDWRNYSSITLFLKSDIPGGSFELHFKEQDDDEWFYFDNMTLSKDGWIRIKIPFAKFIQPKWTSKGDGEKELYSITEIGITFTSFDMPLNKTLYMSVIDGEIFSLS